MGQDQQSKTYSELREQAVQKGVFRALRLRKSELQRALAAFK